MYHKAQCTCLCVPVVRLRGDLGPPAVSSGLLLSEEDDGEDDLDVRSGRLPPAPSSPTPATDLHMRHMYAPPPGPPPSAQPPDASPTAVPLWCAWHDRHSAGGRNSGLMRLCVGIAGGVYEQVYWRGAAGYGVASWGRCFVSCDAGEHRAALSVPMQTVQGLVAV